jgi:tRNA modification GTPase
MVYGELRDRSGSKIDDILLLAFVGPHSFTGEDVVEFQCHGSEVIVRKLFESLEAAGARAAGPGEFSFRAFLNEKMSWERVQTLSDVYKARDFADLSRVYGERDSALQGFVARLRDRLLGLQAILDTAVDFSEEYSSVTKGALEPLESIIRECSEVSQRYSRFREAGARRRLVLAGRPNAGKSSLFNALLGRYRAIVDASPGTTRDVVEEEIEIGGHRWRLADTAGVRQAEGAIEGRGLELGEAHLQGASFWILVVDGTEGLGDTERELLEAWDHKPHLVVSNKRDKEGWKPVLPGAAGVSALMGEGIAELWAQLESELQTSAEDRGPLPTLALAIRLQAVEEELLALRADLQVGLPPEVLGERGRRALGLAEELVGSVDPEALLDKVFSEFCIGK